VSVSEDYDGALRWADRAVSMLAMTDMEHLFIPPPSKSYLHALAWTGMPAGRWVQRCTSSLSSELSFLMARR
jgi:hypothetical protein